MRERTGMLCGLLLLSGLWAQSLTPTETLLRMPDGYSIGAAVRADVNGDGQSDLILQIGDEKGIRLVRVHYRQDSAPFYRDPPDEVHTAPLPATAFSAIRVGSSKKRTLFFWNRRGATPSIGPEGRLEFAVEADFLWQMPRNNGLIPWQDFVRDLDGDGLEDLLVPEPDGVLLVMQGPPSDKGEFRPRSLVRCAIQKRLADLVTRSLGVRQAEQRNRRERFVAKNAPGLGLIQSETLVDVAESTPVAVLEDFDGDGRVDLLMRGATEWHIWRQQPGGRFAEKADLELPLPFAARAERDLDLAWALIGRDISKDQKLDAIFTMKRPRGEDLGSQIIVFNQGYRDRRGRGASEKNPLFGDEGYPRQVIPLRGLAIGTRLTDIDGDGSLDLTLASFSPDAMDRLTGSSRQLEVTVLAFRNAGGEFSREPALSLPLVLAADDLDEIAQDMPVRFFSDLNRDLIQDLLVRPKGRTIAIHASERLARGSFRMSAEPTWTRSFGFEAKLEAFPADGGQSPELWLVGWRDFLCITF